METDKQADSDGDRQTDRQAGGEAESFRKRTVAGNCPSVSVHVRCACPTVCLWPTAAPSVPPQTGGPVNGWG